MSDLIDRKQNGYRNQLLVTASVLALAVSASDLDVVAKESDRPTLWIELGAQYDQAPASGHEPYAPSFFDLFSQTDLTVPTKFENKLPWSFGGNAQLSYRPADSDWEISASIRYGRTQSSKHVHQQDPKPSAPPPFSTFLFVRAQRYADTVATKAGSHMIADFQVGKDVGLGIFGNGDNGVAALGIRFAHFTSESSVKVLADPDFQWYQGDTLYFPPYSAYVPFQRYHAFDGSMEAARSFHGVGPEISWKANSRLAGDRDSGHLALDWGLNAGILFGRQKANVHHKTTALQYRPQYDMTHGIPKYVAPDYQHSPAPSDRSRMVLVPNVGGFAGLSLNWPNAKVSMGYRADIFFGAMDGGIDTRKSINSSFYGPFASISIGMSPSDW